MTAIALKVGRFYLRAMQMAAKPAFWLAIGFFAGVAFASFSFGLFEVGQTPSF
jgi:hypothetical protein